MLFSIVVPVYNVEKYLDECMYSILSQVDKIDHDCEILLIDDGSTDLSGEICDKYKHDYSDMVKVFHKKNEGLLLTRRFGFMRASGEYIINCDSDDMLEAGMLYAVKNTITNYGKPDIVIINHNMYNNGVKTLAYEDIFTSSHDCLIEKTEVVQKFMMNHSIVSLWGKIIKRSCIDLSMDYNIYGKLSTGEDTLQTIEFFSRAKTYVYLNEALYNYRCASGMTAKFDSDYYFTFKRIFELMQQQREDWKLKDFEGLFAIKVLQTTGRAITQSRFNKWSGISEQKKYFMRIRNDDMLINNIKYINKSRNYLQFDHFVLLKLLQYRFYTLIVILLLLKNKINTKHI